ncbi:DeoR/GlpR family DNA-binding transcription regulator [Rugosimonospora africana]|uniref:Transcriptional regulator n=1 Tax=Rugosimonospora africana TaxID=556532 RepID=A0A8J3QUD2_9ACTN|nr:DeoR/GlpR family DNA-binding transcription regulator [Rugosimonospora africana]GIH16177.1 transcriptional regulator [Rugosimonospora africana]
MEPVHNHRDPAVARNAATRRRHRADRFGWILRVLAENGSVDVADLAVDLGVSEATVRRDLRSLADQRLLERAHGGAVFQGSAELPVRYRAGQAHAEKVRIARAAADRVGDGEVIALTGGTTTLEIARFLAQRGEVSVVTNALNIAAELAVRPNVKLIVTGGVARGVSYELVGPLADSTLGKINIDVAFVGVDGVDRDAGLTTQNETEAATNRALIERSRRAIVVADASKLGRVVFAGICPLSSVAELITDDTADPEQVDRLRTGGLRVAVI